MDVQRLSFLLTPIGSSGDVNPFVGVGRELRRRGHDVTVITGGTFQRAVEEAGLRFVASVSAHEFDRAANDPDLWHPRRGLAVVLRMITQHMRALYAHLADAYEPGRTVLVGHALAFATRTFAEVHGAPAATLHLAPSIFRSDFEQPAYAPGRDLSRAPLWAKRSIWWLIDRMLIDPHLAGELNRWRAELGLAPVRRPFNTWIHAPRCVVGLFPAWFAPPQPDWPAAVHLTGFPLWDEGHDRAFAPELEEFLAAGAPPIVFTPGSAHRHASSFFSAAVEASARLGRRAVLATRYAEQLPARLPSHVCHVPHAPFALLLPRAAAVVHHGGIGTSAQGLAAGIPQLVMPMAFDQPDNFTRLARLGVARHVTPSRFRGARVAHQLAGLLGDPGVAAACKRWAAEIAAHRPIDETCDLLERIPA